MLGAVFRIMWLRLWRDRGALVLAFILPGFIFAIFAAIFSNASGGDLDIRVAMAVTTDAPDAVKLSETIQETADFTLSFDQSWTQDNISERVRLGQDDVGVVLQSSLGDRSSAPFLIISDPSRKVAETILRGELSNILTQQSGSETPDIFDTVSALPSNNTAGPQDQSVTYYIGATAILFLLFSAMQGAVITLDERRNGISDRLLLGPKGALSLLCGKFLFLTLVGTVQASIIVLVANIFFSVPVAGHIPALALACLGSASLAAAIALLVASLCESASQMNTVSTFTVLLFSAVGGSMVPRFMMPDWLQSLGLFTPNHWAIEAFYGTLARGQSIADLAVVWVVLFLGAALCLILSAVLSHKLLRT